MMSRRPLSGSGFPGRPTDPRGSRFIKLMRTATPRPGRRRVVAEL